MEVAMSEVTSRYPVGTPSWADLMTSDREAAVDFYRAVFGWDVEVGPEETGFYTTCLVRGLPVAGIGQQPPGQQAFPVAWTTYFAVDDLDGTVDKIKNAGGTVLMDPMAIMEEGRMAVAADPTGAVFGMWEPGRMLGARIVNEPGALCWNELVTRSPETAKEFYRTVFGHGMERMEGDFDYTQLKVGDRMVAGLMGMGDDFPADTPPHWRVYFGVAETDATVAKITEKGGAVLDGPHDSPFGRWATVRDPQGAAFCVITVPPEQPGQAT
jgi:predicted enzyme related to lactoylglutathione lyase